MSTWNNDDGLEVRFGAYHADKANRNNRTGSVVTEGSISELTVPFDLQAIGTDAVSFSVDTNNDGTKNAFNEADPFVPKGAAIIEAFVVMDEAAAGGTSMNAGFYEKDGSGIDADGLIGNTAGALANLTAGDVIKAGGADVEETVSTTLDAYIGIRSNGTFTAGKGKLVVRYLTK